MQSKIYYLEKYPFLVEGRSRIDGVNSDMLYPFQGYLGQSAHSSQKSNGAILWSKIFECKKRKTLSQSYSQSMAKVQQTKKVTIIDDLNKPCAQTAQEEQPPFAVIRK